MTFLFVYGTLKRGGTNHGHLAGQQFVGMARTQPGFTLHVLGDYPGLVRASDDTSGIVGELWAVDAAALAQLDLLEGMDEGLYVREPVVLVPPHDNVVAEAYLYRRDVSGRPRLGPEWPG